MDNIISAGELAELARLEAIIERGLKTFVEVGTALSEIRDRRLYRKDHKTFEAYCQARWGFRRAHAYRLMSAARVALNVGAEASENMRESHARELVGLSPEEQKIVWQVVKQTAPDGKITAGHVRSVASVLGQIVQTGAVDGGDGVDVVVPNIIEHAITEETYERLQRMRAHIADNSRRVLVFSGTIAVRNGLAQINIEDGTYAIRVYSDGGHTESIAD